MTKKDLMLEVNKIINELAINGDTLLKNYVRLQNKTNEIKDRKTMEVLRSFCLYIHRYSIIYNVHLRH
jgi:hypothetical protein